jgi:hypothetical protein
MAEANPKPTRYVFTVGGNELTIYAKPSTMTPYVGAQTAAAARTPTTVTSSIDSHTRRRYPGDPGSNVASHARVAIVGGWRPDPTLPGKRAWFEKTTGTGNAAVTARDQFTFVGNLGDLRTWATSAAVQDFVLRLPSGKAVNIVS